MTLRSKVALILVAAIFALLAVATLLRAMEQQRGWDVAAAAYQPGRLPPGADLGLQASGTFALSGPVFPFGAYAALVEVDRETGEISLQWFVAVDDAGRIVNPLLAEGQVVGAVAQGFGQALWEEVVHTDDGRR